MRCFLLINPRLFLLFRRIKTVFLTVNVGEDCPVFDGLFEFCQLSTGGSVGTFSKHTSHYLSPFVYKEQLIRRNLKRRVHAKMTCFRQGELRGPEKHT